MLFFCLILSFLCLFCDAERVQGTGGGGGWKRGRGGGLGKYLDRETHEQSSGNFPAV